MRLIPTLIALVLLPSALPPAHAQTGQMIAYVGTYTRQNSKGIYAFRFDSGTGKLSAIGLAAATSNPSYLAVHPSHRFLYAANEDDTFQGKPTGAVSAFAIDASTGKLKLLNQVSSGGPGPCHLAVDRSGKWLVVANYNGGSVAAIALNPDGSLGKQTAFVQHRGSSVNPQRQAGPHAHFIDFAPGGRFVLSADLGLDQVLTYRFDGQGGLTPADPPFAKVDPGSGPRHLAFQPDGKFVYLANEMAATVTAFAYDSANGSLKQLQTISMLPKDYTGPKSAAEIAVHPSGRFLYASNRGHDSIAVFAIDPGKGTLTAIEHVPTQGKTPRNFAIDPTGTYLLAANQDSASVVVFRIDSKTGKLSATGEKAEVPFPVCVTLVPAM